jgi:hypothetical protein
MGYYTRYRISVSESSILSEADQEELKTLEEVQKTSKSEKVKKVLAETIKTLKGQLPKEPEEIIADIIGYNPFEDECKWYDHHKEMVNVSETYPNVLFILNGEGEERGDLWTKYYKNGKCQECRAKITYDEFDESKLI